MKNEGTVDRTQTIIIQVSLKQYLQEVEDEGKEEKKVFWSIHESFRKQIKKAP